ncbi:MAG: hypothetical protein E7578_09250 [Ruminococcaceae bacterium]|nr:hypothetical protein [Oscillospiraceae bacterium]
MKITNIAVVGVSEHIVDKALKHTKEFFERSGYTVLVGNGEVLPCETDKVLVIHTECSVEPDAVFYIGEESTDKDAEIISRWTGHPHFRIIGGRYIGDGMTDRLIDEIKRFLGEPEPLEIERKFLIEYPDLEMLHKLPACCRVEIVQVYLKWKDGHKARIRSRAVNGECMYFHTVKKSITPAKRIEIERRLTEEEYLGFLNDTECVKNKLEKDRYCISYDSQYFELDVYPFWNDRAVLEIELLHENEEIRFPEWAKVIREVTGDRHYNNSTLARKVSKGKKA